MCNFENILRFLHFFIALDMSRMTHFLAEIMNPKNSASGKFLTFSMSGTEHIMQREKSKKSKRKIQKFIVQSTN